MIVLGIHCGHDSSAAIVQDGRIIADVAEERLTRIKHNNNVPIQAIQYCLGTARLDNINEIDYIGFSWLRTPPHVRALFGLSGKKTTLRSAAKSFIGPALGMPQVKPPIYFPNLLLDDESKFVNVEHHLAHAASAYFTCKSADKRLVFTVDGAGDNVSTAVWLAQGNKIQPLQKLFREASIGWAYSVVTEGLHWWHGDGEGKTMGLAPYGDYTKCQGVLDKYFPVFNGRKLVKKTNLGQAYHWIEGGSTQFHFDEAYEAEKLIEKYGREDIAAEAQRKLEECLLEYMFGWCKDKGIKKIACAGGVYLNVKLNQRVWNKRGDVIQEQHIFPNAGDCGLAVGAALCTYFQHNEFMGYDLTDLFLGPEFSNQEIAEMLEFRSLKYTRVEDPSKKAAEMLVQNKVIAWFQGRMESGPRALGNRSIVMSPLAAENKDYVNARVKFREPFRPFCPSLLYEKRDEYLVDCRDEEYMITSFDVTPEKYDKIPAVVHVDGTVRPQMVRKEVNPRYWCLINEFGKLTGEYIVLNTSFNIKGEPIINTPREAIRCFFDTGLDALIMGNCLLEK